MLREGVHILYLSLTRGGSNRQCSCKLMVKMDREMSAIFGQGR